MNELQRLQHVGAMAERLGTHHKPGAVLAGRCTTAVTRLEVHHQLGAVLPAIISRKGHRGRAALASVVPALDVGHVRHMNELALYDHPSLYDLLVRPGPCERFYCDLARDTGGPILELACGTGRLTIPLAETGQDVTGLDASIPMLRAGQAKANKGRAAPCFVQGDMRSFDLGRRFALVVVSCHSLSHLMDSKDLLAALSRIVRHLAPGGLFAFDIINPQVRDLAREPAESIQLDAAAGPDFAVSEALIAYDPMQQVRVLEWRFHAPGEAMRTAGPMCLRTIFPQELPLLLRAAGLELVARFGDFERGLLTAGSLNQVCLARAARDGPKQ